MTLVLADCSDGELAALTLAGRHSAFAELMRRHRDPVYRLLRGLVGDGDAALDLVQECFISAFKALARYDSQRPFRAWLSRIALNKARDWSRRQKVRRLFTLGTVSNDLPGIPDPAPPPDAAAADRQSLERLWVAIADLPRQLKEPLLLHTVDGLSQAETAAALGISEKAVETRLYRARSKLASFRASLE